jgi:hypothetical protein
MTTTVTNGHMDVLKRLEPVLRENAALADSERNLPKAAMGPPAFAMSIGSSSTFAMCTR